MNDTNTTLALVPATSAVLREVAKPVTDIAAEVLPHIPEMLALMKALKGAGLAAPQVGIGLRFFVTSVARCKVAINPEIVGVFGGRESKPEGCLTWPGKTRFKARSQSVNIEWTDLGGRRQRQTFSGFSARIMQHETDHLNGICLF